MKTPHLATATQAMLVLIAVLTGAATYARWIESRYIHALAPQAFEQKDQGSALQREAFRYHDLLPIYGSSELTIPNPYHASVIFSSYPTGFTVFPVGKPGTTSLIILQDLAAVGSGLRGKKLVISVSPGWFFQNDAAVPGEYAGNFSRLHAGELAFSTDLSFAVKQGAARRMLQYPATLEKDPLLKFALELLADGSSTSRILYYTALPLGKLQNLILRLQDHWETITLVLQQVGLKPVVSRQPVALDWPALLLKARSETRARTAGNPFGFPTAYWQLRSESLLKGKNAEPDAVYLGNLQNSKEWGDLGMLLQGLGDLGAQALVLSVPINDRYLEFLGVTSISHGYYEKLHQVAARFRVGRIIDFASHGRDEECLAYPMASLHPTETGWAYYDKVIDAFYHDQTLDDV